jgi:hypothetical protein
LTQRIIFSLHSLFNKHSRPTHLTKLSRQDVNPTVVVRWVLISAPPSTPFLPGAVFVPDLLSFCPDFSVHWVVFLVLHRFGWRFCSRRLVFLVAGCFFFSVVLFRSFGKVVLRRFCCVWLVFFDTWFTDRFTNLLRFAGLFLSCWGVFKSVEICRCLVFGWTLLHQH